MSDLSEAQRAAARARHNANQKAYVDRNRERVHEQDRAYSKRHPDRIAARKQRRKKLIKQDEAKRLAFNKRNRESAKRSNAAMSKPRGGYQWTGPELEIIERDDLTARQCAVMIGRSLAAVHNMRKRIRREPKLQRVLGAQP